MSKEDFDLTYYADVQSRAINWLWYPYIPYGKITIVQGDPGEGKTTFVLSLLSIISKGQAFPGSDVCVSGKAIYQNAEDDNSDTIKPRLEMHEANCANICFIDKDSGIISLDGNELEKAVRQTQAKILVLDPIQSFLGENVDMNRANSIRPRLTRLKEIAERTGCAVILVGHLNKNSGGKANYHGLGSIDISAAARSVLVIGRPADNPEIRVMAQQKNNLGPIGTSMAFAIQNGKVEWLGDYGLSASELLSGSGTDSESGKLLSARMLLQELLKDGEMPFNELANIAAEEDIGKRTLRTAKASLKVESVKKGDAWYWRLPTNQENRGDSNEK